MGRSVEKERERKRLILYVRGGLYWFNGCCGNRLKMDDDLKEAE